MKNFYVNKIRFLRQQAIKELLRIVKKDGIVLIYVWAFEQEERTFTEQDIFVPWNLQYKFEDENTIHDLTDHKKPDPGFFCLIQTIKNIF